ncbi:hypothetical protein V1523DRAFT_406836 [Lipomyces doorenjongii]
MRQHVSIISCLFVLARIAFSRRSSGKAVKLDFKRFFILFRSACLAGKAEPAIRNYPSSVSWIVHEGPYEHI